MIPPRELPAPLRRLTELALDLRLSGSAFAARLWRSLDPDAWERIGNPYLILLDAHQDRLERAARDEGLMAEFERWIEARDRLYAAPGWFGETHPDAGLGTVAYFSMEFGLGEALPIYSGGLGILAGDHLKSASDLGLPLVGVGLLYQQGYFRQVLSEDGDQLEAMPYNDPSTLPVQPARGPDGRWPRVRLELPGRTLFLRAWEARVGRVTLYLLDSNDPLNAPWDRAITANLYAAGRDRRLLQEICLGIGGWRLLELLGLDVTVCHLNEGHAAFCVLARAESFARAAGVPFEVALAATRAGNVFTTHTPVEAAFDRFEPALLVKYGLPFAERCGLEPRRLLALGRRDPEDDDEPFNMAYLALRGSRSVNGVSELHARVSRRLFADLFGERPAHEVPVGAVTNGVHVPTWSSEPAAELWGLDGGGEGPPDLEAAARRVAELDPARLWDFRAAQRARLVEYVRRRHERAVRGRGEAPDRCRRARHVLDPNRLTLGLARRFTEYKRPNLILTDPERLAALLTDPERPVQLIVAGKAHPDDADGKRQVRAMAEFARRPDVCDQVVFLEDHDMVLARHLAAGIDVWLNTPRRPSEACGTSGMKMLACGGLHCSTLDGWWDEAWEPELGWAIGGRAEHTGDRDAEEAEELYRLLAEEIAPEFYARDREGLPRAWIERVRASMTRLSPRFSSDRMVREYTERCYLPAAAALRARTADGAALAAELVAFERRLREEGEGLRFGAATVTREGATLAFEQQVFLGDLEPGDVTVELYADPEPGSGAPTRVAMHLECPLAGAVNGFLYTAVVEAGRPAEHFTPRAVPSHPALAVPLESTWLRWRR